MAPKSEIGWLTANPPLIELMERYPEEWEKVGNKLLSLLKEGKAERLNVYALKARWMAEKAG